MRVVVRVSQDDSIRALVGNVFDAANDSGEKWVGDVGDDHAQHTGLISPQTAGQLAGVITEASDSLHDSSPQFLPNFGGPIDNVRHRADGDIGSFSNLPHGDR